MSARTSDSVWERAGLGFSALAVFFAVASARAQATREFVLRGLTADLVDTPAIAYSGGGRVAIRTVGTGQNRWLRIEAQYESAPEWADDVRLEYHVLLGDLREPIYLKGEETYIHVARGRGHVAAMFVHPKTVQRYMKTPAPRQISVLLYYQNRLIDAASQPPSSARWWEQLTPVVGQLLPRSQTPWAVLDDDRYEMSKPKPTNP